ncbi:hypothetical protein DW708_11710 [Ruminococcus sp. AM27-11LB]|uniref:hypothetical protein n=1 Tax=Mediterraneibacter TaxID=2316020 RepID=UPI000E4DB57F|nr:MULTISPECIES: hypothetical protein [Mediterraneibacter]RGH93735.1 hypothetical protein DW708_11710 [Ruminococcus sp. AM27-11LB]RGH94988.1 hypothetical protein DW719_03610 [Ruminococcus sp. AM27-27]
MANIDLDEYEKRNYKFSIGNLYDGQSENVVEKGERAIFDTVKNNYHFYPLDEALCNTWSNNLENKRSKIIEQIKGYSSINLCENWIELDKIPENDFKIYIYAGNSGELKKEHKTVCSIFKYMCAVKNGVLYELNFMRFYIDHKRVNCTMKKIQFDRVIDNGKMSQRTVNHKGICYPETDSNETIEELEKRLNDNKQKSIFFNPEVTYEDEPDKIINAFLEFIKVCDEHK